MPNKHAEDMYSLYGKDESRTCKGCVHICSYTANRKWYKCEAYGISNSEATDWTLSTQACGLYGKPLEEGYIPVKRRIWHHGKPNDSDVIQGQISIDELIKKEGFNA